MSPTLTRLRQGSGGHARDATRVGVILGTAAYMSPEQAKGKKVDKRTDIFAFGAVLYEMLTGKKAFPGEDVGEILASVIKLEPDWEALPPEELRLVRRCLEKDPRARMRDIGEVRVQLADGTAPPASAELSRTKRTTAIGYAALGLVAGLLIAAALFSSRERDVPADRSVRRATIRLPAGQTQPRALLQPLALSPDGSQLVYVAEDDTGPNLYLRGMDSFEVRKLPGTSYGLDHAHRAGIVHRDLKPGNAMLTKLGIKLLDFGLAKLLADGAGSDSSDAPTQTKQKDLTAEQAVVGTLQYMAPEQLEAKAADARTDIFAFGAMFYEMVTGNKAFDGKSQASLITAIMSAEPPSISKVEPTTPSLERLIRKCLAKDPDSRWQTARDLTDEVRWIAEGDAVVDASKSTPMFQMSHGARVMWGLAGALIATVITAAVFWDRPPSDSRPVTRFTITAEGLLPRGAGPLLALSSDGRSLAYVSERDGVREIYRRDMERFEDEPIRGTENAILPFFSPDGAWLGFAIDGGALKKISLAGGPPVTICAGCNTRAGGTWGPDDVILIGEGGGGLRMVPASGGDPTAVTTLAEGETIHRQAEILPGGKALLFTALTGTIETATIELYSLDTGERRRLVDGTHPFYAPTGHIVFVREQSLWAIPFDVETLETKGEAIPLVEGIQVERGGATQFALADNGTLVYVPIGGAGDGAERALVWVDRQGNRTPLEQEQREFSHPRFSPDGRRILLQIAEEGQKDIWLYDVERESLARQTLDAISFSPVWTPDGARLTFTAWTGSYHLFWKLAEGGENREQLLEQHSELPRARSWSPDGTRLAFQKIYPETGADIWIFSMDEREASPFLATPANEDWPVFSADGQWIAYESDESGQREVYLTTYPGSEHKRQVSIAGGGDPRWRSDGSELFYISEAGVLMAVPVATTPTLRLGAPLPLFELSGREYDVHPSGERFLIVRTERQATPGHINVVLNWFEELKRLVPTGN